ncbi:hypothetical protein FRC10_005257 [Ceratobasidium sp. 414]|nr:hypothetical protein FRC10_005257 [Ceratobasidium sp. 414]
MTASRYVPGWVLTYAINKPPSHINPTTTTGSTQRHLNDDTMPLDHVALGRIKDVEASRVFYEKALAPLGYKVQMSFPKVYGFGSSPYMPDFWIADVDVRPSEVPIPVTNGGTHVAFKGTRAQVHAFHEAALQDNSQSRDRRVVAGGTCNGPPGFRTNYHPFYYGAFVIDPSGNNIEVVNHGSGWQWFWYIIGTKLGFVTPTESYAEANPKED